MAAGRQQVDGKQETQLRLTPLIHVALGNPTWAWHTGAALCTPAALHCTGLGSCTLPSHPLLQCVPHLSHSPLPQAAAVRTVRGDAYEHHNEHSDVLVQIKVKN